MMTAKILLIEDDYEQALLFARALEVCECTVEIAASAEEAQAKLAAEPYAPMPHFAKSKGSINCANW